MAITGLLLEFLYSLVSTLVGGVVEKTFYRVRGLVDGAFLKAPKISVCPRTVRECRKAVLGMPFDKGFIDVSEVGSPFERSAFAKLPLVLDSDKSGDIQFFGSKSSRFGTRLGPVG